ncbi:unnamed protein product [Psylliodes chrysocephalus]|uniref:Androgen-dependent TFPI-regulating protein n=1 Tax=Psylliodes chrysocephalus TaxID=3402493 RepID=A0A9P0CNH7_9CUCU|nr:unnamed protein product [Psylliodes chrysocephala]
MKMKYAGLILFSCTLFINVYSLKYFVELTNVMQDKVLNYSELSHLNGFEFCYLTLWTFIFQMFFMIVAILDEASKLLNLSLDKQKMLSKTRAVMYNTILFPSSLIVTTLFWTLYYIERDLIFPRILDSFFPWWLNHMLHTFIILPVVIELMLPKKYNFVSFSKAAPVLVTILVFYTILYFSIYFRHGIWLYPIYKVMSWPQRALFTIFQMCLALTYQKIGISLQDAKMTIARRKVC